MSLPVLFFNKQVAAGAEAMSSQLCKDQANHKATSMDKTIAAKFFWSSWSSKQNHKRESIWSRARNIITVLYSFLNQKCFADNGIRTHKHQTRVSGKIDQQAKTLTRASRRWCWTSAPGRWGPRWPAGSGPTVSGPGIRTGYLRWSSRGCSGWTRCRGSEPPALRQFGLLTPPPEGASTNPQFMIIFLILGCGSSVLVKH